jgi:hypothetical protein
MTLPITGSSRPGEVRDGDPGGVRLRLAGARLVDELLDQVAALFGEAAELGE